MFVETDAWYGETIVTALCVLLVTHQGGTESGGSTLRQPGGSDA